MNCPKARRPAFRAVAPIVVWILALAASSSAQTGADAQIDATLEFARQQLLATVDDLSSPTAYPRATDPVTGEWTTKGPQDWTAGFFPGLLWRVFLATNDPDLLLAAQDWTAGLSGQATRTDTHDLGFMIGIPFGLGLLATGDPGYETVLLTSADSLSGRFDDDVGAMRSWDFGSWQFPVIIDNMMNLELFFLGASLMNDPVEAARRIDEATQHADTTYREHVRNDGTTYHLVDFSPTTGAVILKQTWQGYGSESTWTRGQAWALYGFSMLYRETGLLRMRDHAMETADAFLAELPADSVPFWDIDDPDIPNAPRDSSAAAIAASGLVELSDLVTDPVDRERYRSAAWTILTSLMSPGYLSDGTESAGLLLHATGSKPTEREVDVTLIYGDYYFVEALIRYRATTPLSVPSGGRPMRTIMGLAMGLLGVASARALGMCSGMTHFVNAESGPAEPNRGHSI
jgi:unsaturated chondroitin disaccharide hydrolase